MRIKKIVEADFRLSDASLFEEFSKKNRELVGSLGSSDVVAFLSLSGTQILFIHGFEQLKPTSDNITTDRKMLPSTRYRLLNGTWNPLMLRNYAEAAGMKIEGLKLFEEHYKELRAA